jgi:cytochrome c556
LDSSNSKRNASAEKLAKTTSDLEAAKAELEVKLQSFAAEQEKLHDSYEKHKQELNQKSDQLHKELEKLETDTSTTARQTACNTTVEAINNLLKRVPPSTA